MTSMKVVGIKLLKARLSEYVRLARAGEVILVSDRDEVVAELGPPRYQVSEPDSVEAILDRLAERGSITRASQPRVPLEPAPAGLGLSPEAVTRLLDELREDRWG
jgi:antitoxin (DNA-binding transcriptional repressor) of toxin-antitoxin stability system